MSHNRSLSYDTLTPRGPQGPPGGREPLQTQLKPHLEQDEMPSLLNFYGKLLMLLKSKDHLE